MKMAIVGCEASGKTVFMCALADYYGRDAASNPFRIRLTPENQSANSFERYQYRQLRMLRQWPPATPPERTIEMKWALRRNGKQLAEIDMLEFGGETYRAAFRGDSEEADKDASVQELREYLLGADFFVVLVSIKALLSSDRLLTNVDFDREIEALWVTRGILEFIRSKRPDAGIVIGLTQADRYRNEIADAGGPQQLLATHWPTLAAAAQGVEVVDVASVSKTDDQGNPADGYNTHGVLPVMKAFSRHCFGDENALENGSKRLVSRVERRRNRIIVALGAIIVAACAFGVLRTVSVMSNAHDHSKCKVEFQLPATVTNTVEKIVEKVVERPVTNTVEKIVNKVVERPVTNTVEKVVEKVVVRPVTKTVTNTVEKIVHKVVEKPVTNTVEKIVEKVVQRTVTNVVERVVEKKVPVLKGALPKSDENKLPVTEVRKPSDKTTKDAVKKLPPGYRVWTDYDGRKIIAKWTGVAVDESGITILTRYNRRIDAVLWKFSQEDQEYIKSEIKRHADLGETMIDGVWTRNPMLKKK